MARQVLLCMVLAAVAAPAAAAQPRSRDNCGGVGQSCCLSCPQEVAASECDQRECTGGRTCHMFGLKRQRRRGEEPQPDMNICLQTPACGKEGQPCCFSSDPTSEAERCSNGHVCISERVGYADKNMYAQLVADPANIKSTKVMGTCRNMTLANCGKRFYPCGAAARRLGCPEEKVQCASSEDFCASPSDTMLGAARCLPLPPRCGQRNNACCPANKDLVHRELWLQDGRTPVPYCSDGASMCLWRHIDFASYGLRILNEAGGSKTLTWDGYFQRGYGQSRCAPLPASCGNPGEPCCPSMLDQRLSGMVHNKRFRYQPCNYMAAGKIGIYCKGSWQGELLTNGEPLGTCTLNTADCGKLGKQCCREDLAESGPVTICETKEPPGTHYCTEDNVCARCPAAPATKLQKENCRQPGAPEAGPAAGGSFGTSRGFGRGR